MPTKTAPRAAVASPSHARLRDTSTAEHFKFDRVACRDCGNWFPAPEGSALLYSLKGPCPNCGGDFILVLGEAD